MPNPNPHPNHNRKTDRNSNLTLTLTLTKSFNINPKHNPNLLSYRGICKRCMLLTTIKVAYKNRGTSVSGNIGTGEHRFGEHPGNIGTGEHQYRGT